MYLFGVYMYTDTLYTSKDSLLGVSGVSKAVYVLQYSFRTPIILL